MVRSSAFASTLFGDSSNDGLPGRFGAARFGAAIVVTLLDWVWAGAGWRR